MLTLEVLLSLCGCLERYVNVFRSQAVPSVAGDELTPMGPGSSVASRSNQRVER